MGSRAWDRGAESLLLRAWEAPSVPSSAERRLAQAERRFRPRAAAGRRGGGCGDTRTGLALRNAILSVVGAFDGNAGLRARSRLLNQILRLKPDIQALLKI